MSELLLEAQNQIEEVRSALGAVAHAADDNPWNDTHDQLLSTINGVADPNIKSVLTSLFGVVAILNTKMVNFFLALSPFAPAAPPDFVVLVSKEKEWILGAPEDPLQVDDPDRPLPPVDPQVLAKLADTLRRQARAHYKAYLRGERVAVEDAVAAVGEMAGGA
jgi:hypothetical protein